MKKITYIEGQEGEDYCKSIYQEAWYECISSGGNSADFDLVFEHIVNGHIKTVEGKMQVEMLEYGSVSVEIADTSIYYSKKGYLPTILPDGTPAYATGLLASKADEYFFTDGISYFIVPKSVLLTHYYAHKHLIHHFPHTDSAYGYTISIDDLKKMSTWMYIHHTPASKVWLNKNREKLLNILNSLDI